LNKDHFATPWDLFYKIEDDLGIKFVFDVCASKKNHKCKNYFTAQQNALKKDWSKEGFNFWNAPHSKNKYFVKKAYDQYLNRGVKSVGLIPLNVLSSEYAFKYIHGIAEIKFLKGRPKFLNPTNQKISKFPSRNGYILIIYGKVSKSTSLNISPYNHFQ